MKRYIIYILLAFASGATAQEAAMRDSLPDSIATDMLLDIDYRLMEHTMQWLDTTECDAVHEVMQLPDSVYMERLCSLPYVIEMPYNPLIKRYIEIYVNERPKQVARLKRLSEYYFPIFEDALHRHGLPEELKYLPVIESGLFAQAHSPMGAAGLWQFMPSTAKGYGLEVNSLVDERLDPLKSTEAACKFLRHLYNIYQDWNLAIAAYNCGPGNVNKAIHRANGERDFWSIFPFLPKETRSYLPLFIAANYAMNFADEHNICPAERIFPIATDTIATDKRQHLLQVATVLDIDIKELRRLNSQYQLDVLPGGKTYALCLPQEKTAVYIALEDSVVTYKADSLINNRRKQIELAQKTSADGYSVNGITYYKIKEGDTLSGIAKKFRCSVAQLQRWNSLKTTNIRAGKTLKIHK